MRTKQEAFASEALQLAVEKGIINGYGDGRINPKGPATRAQVARMLMRYLKDMEEKLSELSEETQVSREWIYQQKRRVEEEAQLQETREPGIMRIEVTETWLRRFVISLALDCQGSAEGIQRTCSEVIGVHLLIGEISKIINEAAEKRRNLMSRYPWITSGKGHMMKYFRVPSRFNRDRPGIQLSLFAGTSR